MVSCLSDIHVWSLKNLTVVPDNVIGCYTYHDKTEADSSEHLYLEEKAIYTEGRNVTWMPKNKRPEKLRDSLRELEELLTQHRSVRCKWLTRRILQIVLSTGTVVTMLISIHTGDIDRIFIDKSLVGKFSSESPSDVLLTDSYMIVAHPDKTKLDFICFTKRSAGDAVKRFEKFSTYDPKVCQVELQGPVSRKLDRKLICNLHQDVVLCWWPTASEEAWPWSPMTGEGERANMVLYAVNGQGMDLISYIRSDCDPIGISYSLMHPSKLFTVEQSSGSRGEINVDTCVYDCSRKKIHRISVTTIPLRSSVLCYNRNFTEDKLLLGCEDGTLVLFDEYRKVTQTTTVNLIPSLIRWHPSGTVVIVASQKGELQVFDMALAPLMFQVVSEDQTKTKTLELGPFFRSLPVLSSMHWSPLIDHPENRLPECNDSIFMMFNRGPMVLVQYYLGVMSQGHLGPLSLVNQYIKYQQIDEALNILSTLNWNSEGKTCYACLSAIANHLLRSSLNVDREAQLETALGTFYAPSRPLSEITVLEFRDPISRLARRFFHHLLRYCRFDKAFLLAVDIGARDLFMDIHFLARDKGETALAEVARQKAEQVETASVGTDSVDDEDLSVESDSLDDSYSGSDEEYLGSPPPRPPRMNPLNGGYLGKGPPPLPPRAMGEHAYQNVPLHQAGNDSSSYYASQQALGRQPQPWMQGPYMDMTESALRELEASLATQLEEEYTETLMEEPILPPPPSHADVQQEGDHSTATVKVIHFGIV